jgi:hypothetical protein
VLCAMAGMAVSRKMMPITKKRPASDTGCKTRRDGALHAKGKKERHAGPWGLPGPKSWREGSQVRISARTQ